MATSQFKEYVSLGESFGLTGADLLNFAREQSEADRLKRAEERQAAKETKELELKLVQQQQEAAGTKRTRTKISSTTAASC